MDKYIWGLTLLIGIHCTAWGQKWEASSGDFFHAIYPLDSMRLWGLRQADAPQADLRCAYSSDGGQTWTDRGTFPTAAGLYVPALLATDELHLWFVVPQAGNGGIYRRTIDGGQTWLNFTLPYGTLSWHFGDAQNGFAIVQNPQLGQPFQLYRTDNGGDTWVLMFNPFNDLTAYDYVTSSWAKAGVFWLYTAKGRIYKTTDTGQTWQWLATVPEEAVYGGSIAFEDENTGIVRINLNGAVSILRKTTDGGQTWSLLYENGLPLEDMETIRTVVPVPGKPHHWVAGTLRGTAWSGDGGVTWTRTSTATQFDFWKIVFTSSTHAYGFSVGRNYHQEWKGPIDVRPCISFLSPLQSRMKRGCNLSVALSARVDISGDTGIQVGWWSQLPELVGGQRKFVANLKEIEGISVHFTPEPGTPYIGTLTVETPFEPFWQLDSTEAINRYQLFPTSCETDTTATIAVRPGIFYELFHRNCFRIETDTANCSVHLVTNVCGYDTAHYTIRYWFPNLQQAFPWVNTDDTFVAPHTPINELITFYIIRDEAVFDSGYGCFDTLQVHLICGVSDVKNIAAEKPWLVSPNPAREWTALSHPDRDKSAILTVSDITGQRHLVQTINHATVVETASWPQGIYLLHLQDTRTGQISTQKLMVIR